MGKRGVGQDVRVISLLSETRAIAETIKTYCWGVFRNKNLQDHPELLTVNLSSFDLENLYLSFVIGVWVFSTLHEDLGCLRKYKHHSLENVQVNFSFPLPLQ